MCKDVCVLTDFARQSLVSALCTDMCLTHPIHHSVKAVNHHRFLFLLCLGVAMKDVFERMMVQSCEGESDKHTCCDVHEGVYACLQLNQPVSAALYSHSF